MRTSAVVLPASLSVDSHEVNCGLASQLNTPYFIVLISIFYLLRLLTGIKIKCIVPELILIDQGTLHGVDDKKNCGDPIQF